MAAVANFGQNAKVIPKNVLEGAQQDPSPPPPPNGHVPTSTPGGRRAAINWSAVRRYAPFGVLRGLQLGRRTRAALKCTTTVYQYMPGSEEGDVFLFAW